MLTDKEFMAFIPTTQKEKAKTFYKEILGLKFVSDDGFAMVFDANGIMLRVNPVKELTPFPFSIAGWKVKDIVSEIQALNIAGVQFEKYGFFPQDELGIWVAPDGTKVAWFKDPDGNTLSLTQF